MRRNPAVIEKELDWQRPPARSVLEQQQLRLADLKANPDRIEWHDGRQRLGRGFRDEATDLQETVTDPTADRRANRRVFQVQLRGPQDRAIRLKRGFSPSNRRLGRLSGGERVVE